MPVGEEVIKPRGEMSNWNLADVWEVVAEQLPDAPALIHGDRRQAWSETNRRANGLADHLLGQGFRRQDKVAHYLYNCSEYLESTFAIFKAGLAPVNTNYRYGPDELVYLWENADAVAVIFHGAFSDRISQIKDRLPLIQAWLWVDDKSGACPDWATPYEDAAAGGSQANVSPDWGRSPDDVYILYTGGTTGYPKGVLWRQDDLFVAMNAAALLKYPADGNLEDVRSILTRPSGAHLPACPLMHGTGALTSFSALSTGSAVVTLTQRTFSPTALLDTVQRERAMAMAIVGDAFGKPILRQLDANPGRWDISSLILIISSGVIWSEETKQGLHRHNPSMLLVYAFSSSEALGMGTSISTADTEVQTAHFVLGENTRVITEDGTDVKPGSGEA